MKNLKTTKNESKGFFPVEKKNFKEIKNYPNYFVNKKGEIFSYKRNKLKKMKLYTMPTGYMTLTLIDKKNTPKTCYVHQIVANTFKKRPVNAEVVHHLDHNKQNNTSTNLRFTTYKKNTQEAVKNGKMSTTNRSGAVILTTDDVEYIFDSAAKLARFMNLSHVSIYYALRGDFKIKNSEIKYAV
jgi:hypothetical protein